MRRPDEESLVQTYERLAAGLAVANSLGPPVAEMPVMIKMHLGRAIGQTAVGRHDIAELSVGRAFRHAQWDSPERAMLQAIIADIRQSGGLSPDEALEH